ncbi:unnamed protein product, partial [Porites lobata]
RSLEESYQESAAVKQVLLVQPSSAAAVRAFSLLSAAFNVQQDSALADYLQASTLFEAGGSVCIMNSKMYLKKFCRILAVEGKLMADIADKHLANRPNLCVPLK